MKTRVQKSGNDFIIPISQSIMKKARLKEDSIVEVCSMDGKILATPIDRKSKLTLKSLLERVSNENIHKEISL